jgi:kynurenine formamidase
VKIPRIVDLTHAFDENSICWSADEKFERTPLAYGRYHAGIWYANFCYRSGEHCGTHMDAPIHFAEGKRSMEQIPVAQLIGPGVKISVADACSRDRDYRLQAADILAWETRLGRIPDGAIVLVHNGWGRYWEDRAAYLGSAGNNPADFHFPGIARDAAQLLAAERRIAMVGIDTASLDHGPSRDYITHQILCGAEIPGVENIAGMERLPETGFVVLALPMKIAGGSGAPCRIVALLDT